MSRWVPFTVHVEITPVRVARNTPATSATVPAPVTGNRFSTRKELERIAVLIHDALVDDTSLRLASPGGGQARYTQKFSDYSAGCSVVPQMGNSPARAIITGFYDASSENLQTYEDKQVLSTNTNYIGAGGAHTQDAIPTSTVQAEVKALKALLVADLDVGLPSAVTYSIFRIDYSGIIWGDRGFHFPQ